MKFGLGQFTLQRPPWDTRSFSEIYSDFLRLAELAEEVGFDSIWFAEHHGASDGYNPSLLPMMSAVAARTERLEIGTGVILAPFHNPIRLAEDAAVVDLISNSRVTIGLGLGWADHEYKMFGVEKKARGKRLEEIVDILRLAWSQERFGFHGRFYDLDDASVEPKPQRPIPIFLGGNEDKALQRAAMMADGHFPPSTTGPQSGVERAKKIMDIRNSLAIEGPFRYGMFLPIGLGADADDAWESIKGGLMHVQGAYALWAMGVKDVANASEFAATNFEPTVRERALLGTPEQIVDALRPAITEIDSLGFSDTFISAIIATVGMPFDVAADRVRTYAERVIKPLRG
ncbi:MAG: LLM class flavin-dependent oxidoreductase [Actinomycetota bacterium]|nr:LLM class flavin-dependent oxidoreductase [Actinomycetota bacterium]